MAEDAQGLSGQRDTLETSIDSLQRWLLLFIAVVVAGLLIELFVVFAIFAQARDVLKLVEGLGTLLVVVGVAGELIIEFRAHRKEQALRKINADIEADYKTTLIAAGEKIADLKAQLSPRTLTESQQRLIAEQLDRFRGQRVAFLSHRQKDELRSFSSVLLNLFLRSHWQVVKPPVPVAFALPQDGMIVVMHASAREQAKQAARTLVRELLKADHEIMGPLELLSANADTDLIVLALGAKP